MSSLSTESLETTSSPYINRFLQPDTIIPDLSNPQSWNRYSYVTNRPVNFNDPTGHKLTEDLGYKNYCDDSDSCEDEKPKPDHPKDVHPPTFSNMGDADLYSFSYMAGVGPWFVTWSIDIVTNEKEAGAFFTYGVGPGFHGEKLPGFGNLNDFDWTFVTPQAGVTLWRGAMWGDSIKESVKAYSGPAFQAGGSGGAPFSGGIEYFSSVDPREGMINREVEGIATGIGVGPQPVELHANYVNAYYLPEFSELVNVVCKNIGCGRMK
jgi:hypothetical protein